jgi:hypothetical protein
MYLRSSSATRYQRGYFATLAVAATETPRVEGAHAVDAHVAEGQGGVGFCMY